MFTAATATNDTRFNGCRRFSAATTTGRRYRRRPNRQVQAGKYHALVVREARERTIVGGSASLFVSRLVAGFLSYLGTAAVARVLTTEAWGAFTFVTSITSIIAFLFDFQVSRMVLVEILDDEQNAGEVVGSYMTLRFLLGLVAYIATL